VAILFSEAKLGSLSLQNHLVMSPMTRNRATDNLPNDLMATYYEQRSSAGLIITEGTSPSPNGLGYPRIPGIFSPQQVAGWTSVTTLVRQQGAKIFCQLMHTGRISHPLNLPPGGRVLAPSAIAASEEMFTDLQGMQALPVPEVMSRSDIDHTVEEYAQAARNAIEAGFNGIELHGANGYLLEQFFRPTSNERDDNYGGSVENRARFVLEVAQAVIAAIGADKVGIRLSPYGVFNSMPVYDEMETDYIYLTEKLNSLGLAYIHLVDHSSMGAPTVPDSIKQAIRKIFERSLILSGGYDASRAEQDLAENKADLIAVGRPFLANPDLVERWKNDLELNAPDFASFYTPGEKGYIDYPSLQR
jgi:N-ethylmaleimide reductase